jgi:hypothetical protein
MNEIGVKITGDASQLERAIRGVENAAPRIAGRLNELGSATGRFFDGLSRRATEAERRFNSLGATMERNARRVAEIEARQARLNAQNATRAGGGFGSSVSGGIRDYALGGFAGGFTAGAVSEVVNFGREAVRAYTEASRAQLFLEGTARRANLSIAEQRREVESLRGAYNLTGQAAAGALAAANRVSAQIGRPEDGPRFLRAVSNLALEAGVRPERVPDLIRMLGTGQDEASDLLFGVNPSTIVKDYARRNRVSYGSIGDQEARRIVIDEAIRRGTAAEASRRAYIDSDVGRFDRLTADYEDFKAGAGRGIGYGWGNLRDTFAAGGAGTSAAGLAELRREAARRGYGTQVRLDLTRESGYTTRPPLPGVDDRAAMEMRERVSQIAGDLVAAFADGAEQAAKRRQVEFARTLEQGERVADAQRYEHRVLFGDRPLEAIRFRYQDRERQIIEEARKDYAQRHFGEQADAVLRSGVDPRTGLPLSGYITRDTTQLLGYNTRTRDVEIDRASQEIRRGLAGQALGFRSQFAGVTDPGFAGQQMQAEFDRLRTELGKLGAEFASTAAGVLIAQRQGQAVSLAQGAAGNLATAASLDARRAQLRSRTVASGYRTIRGAYGQPIQVPYFRQAYGESPAAEIARIFSTGASIEDQTTQAFVAGNTFDDARQAAAFGAHFGRQYQLAGLARFRPGDFNDEQRRAYDALLARQSQSEVRQAAAQFAAIIGMAKDLKDLRNKLAGRNPLDDEETAKFALTLENRVAGSVARFAEGGTGGVPGGSASTLFGQGTFTDVQSGFQWSV